MAGRPKKRAAREYFQYQDNPEAFLEVKERVLAHPVVFRPPRLADCAEDDKGRLIRWGLGSGCGAPTLFESGEEMAECIDRYFAWCAEETPPRPPTIAGLAMALGFRNKNGLTTYVKKDEEFSYVLDRALTAIEDYKNVLLLRTDKSPNGIIFDLKNNHGWVDRTATETVHEVGGELSKLLIQLQGNVIRPKSIVEQMKEDAVDAQFEEVRAEESAEVKALEKQPRIKQYMLSDNLNDLL